MDPTLAGFIVTALAALLAWAVAHRAAKIAELQAKVSVEQTRLAAEQTRLAAAAQASEWLAQFREWASEGIDALSESVYECPLDASAPTGTHADAVKRCRHRISALIDRGRLFAPNILVDRVGETKSAAYKGYRHPVLDPLVAAERVLAGDADISHFANRRKALVHTKREFVSRVQAVLQPRAELAQVADLLARSRPQGDPTLGGLLLQSDTLPDGAHGVLRPNREAAGPIPNDL